MRAGPPRAAPCSSMRAGTPAARVGSLTPSPSAKFTSQYSAAKAIPRSLCPAETRLIGARGRPQVSQDLHVFRAVIVAPAEMPVAGPQAHLAVLDLVPAGDDVDAE